MRTSIISEIEQYQPFNEQEAADKQVILSFLKNSDDIFLRENLAAHMTASSWIISPDGSKVLMAYHNIYKSWAWLGGHADGCEDLLAVALKEAREESSISEIHPVFTNIFSLETLSVDGHVKRGKYVPTHLHLNVTYLLQADDSQFVHNKADENSAVGWINRDEVIVKVSEPWFAEHIYRKLNAKLDILGL